jgi:hypothetical protein
MTMMQQATARTCEREAFYERNGGSHKPPLWERPHGSVTARPTPRHRNFRRYLKSFGLITMVGVSANFALPMGKAQARGNFSSTCHNIQLEAKDHSKTAKLSADCTRQDPRQTLRSSINLNDYLTNNQGHLQWRRRPGGGDFQESCSSTGFFLGSSHQLVTFCQLGSQTIDLNERIANIDGWLKYTGGDEKVIFDVPKPTPPSVVPPRMNAGNAR